MEKGKEATNGVAKKEKEAVIDTDKKITLGECYNLSRSIFDLSASCPTMKGKIVFALTKNEAKLESILKKSDKKQQEIINKYVKIDKKGNYILTEPTEEEVKAGAMPQYIYKKDGDMEKAEKEVNELLSQEVDVEFHKIWMNDFENLDISPARNTRIGLFIKYLVTEIRDLRAM